MCNTELIPRLCQGDALPETITFVIRFSLGGWSRRRLLLDCCPLDFRSIFLFRAVLFQFSLPESAFDSPAYKRDETRDSDTAPGNQLRSSRLFRFFLSFFLQFHFAFAASIFFLSIGAIRQRVGE